MVHYRTKLQTKRITSSKKKKNPLPCTKLFSYVILIRIPEQFSDLINNFENFDSLLFKMSILVWVFYFDIQIILNRHPFGFTFRPLSSVCALGRGNLVANKLKICRDYSPTYAYANPSFSMSISHQRQGAYNMRKILHLYNPSINVVDLY